MVKHVVMFQLTKEAIDLGRDKVIASLRASIQGMNGNIPGLIHAELWDNNAGGTHDVALYCEFQTAADIDVFKNHKLHVAHKTMAEHWVTNRVAIDYEY